MNAIRPKILKVAAMLRPSRDCIHLRVTLRYRSVPTRSRSLTSLYRLVTHPTKPLNTLVSGTWAALPDHGFSCEFHVGGPDAACVL